LKASEETLWPSFRPLITPLRLAFLGDSSNTGDISAERRHYPPRYRPDSF